MSATRIFLFFKNKEVWLQIIVWSLFFASINVNWTASWIAESFLPEAVAPHLAIAVPIVFLGNAFWLIPKYLSKKRWFKYIWLSLSLLIGFEIFRALIFITILDMPETLIIAFKNELFGENSIIFGTLNVLIFNSIFYSFIYRFTRDWLKNQSIIEALKLELRQLQLADHSQFIVNKFTESDNALVENEKTDTKFIKTTLAVKKRGGTYLLKIGDVVYFQAQGDFILAFDVFGNKHIINEALKSIKNQVSSDQFFQINRGELINFDYITKFDSYTKNRLEITFKNITDPLYTSNSRSSEFRQWITNH